MNHEHVHHNGNGLEYGLFLILFFVFAATLFYSYAYFASNRKYGHWPLLRLFFWIFGVLSAAMASIGPLANLAHTNFIAHMLVHLLLGMIAPLLISLAAPLTLLLRAAPVKTSRYLIKILRIYPFRFLIDPFIASILNIGGLWLLYTTNLYTVMHENLSIYLFIHIHIFLAGYLFVISMLYIDPIPYRKSFLYRSIAFVVALAGHSILSKYIYAHPPVGVSEAQARIGSMFMFYGGDMVEIAMVFIFCSQWYKAARPRMFYTTKTPYA